MAVYKSVEELIGGTPLVEVCRLEKELGLKARVLCKMEYLNPAGSIKDRAARSMLDAAEAEGKLTPGAVIIEPTSGNTGIGLASLAASRGYRLILTMPETMSEERRNLLKAYGAELVLTDGGKGMAGAIEKAEELAAQIPGSYIPGQFENPANAMAHYRTTGPEIWEDTEGTVDLFIAGAGTGGTLTGTGRYLKEKKPGITVIAAEPDRSPVLSGGTPGPHGLQGIGAGFVPDILDTDIYDAVARVTEEEAYTAARLLAAREGVLVGITSGAALSVALKEAEKPENSGKVIVALLPDTGERYLSTPLFA